MQRIYVDIDALSDREIREILERGDPGELRLLPFSVGMYHRNWKYAQRICLDLTQHEDANVRANAVFGFAHIARTKGCLDKRLVKPVILRELRENRLNRGMIKDAIGDINLFMKWDLARKHRKDY
ncbi:hypothetical protein QWJ34_12200 [Saccharibacillus sp. CPCC 101409]|uniref:hypothetical protein n=1 Tax=Saccharibacillus sp. CPCC 101409 TaxID=3058041 RepID=UPI002673062A|nr:hypothetical protein [Saccharibacillus sp. CPCC 101409]MDO3410524.1 hypothetical protein [Saccharibacillus sp. CPCC 101409]